ncbi:extracellular solute-binding protein [Litorilinea aerophila]|uniref:Sugar ABC transporter substrate-binding protein n=1 Tax=Litorilinea aerophila TaxID=1204385 RepID=A0A540VMG9_9CHLR|nr:extracellular solute-binding protein [Litorilinea aerophila]MCC9074669.1 extracellular solute-binding protein [Litorilinea aerophila]GIV75845.1 MAG: putative ABC transporter extracellular-binding protein YurO [Litorilinea sp.]
MAATHLSRRRFLQMAASTATMTALAACAVQPTGSGEAGQAGAPAGETVKLSFFNRGGQFIEDVMNKQMSLYRESHPEIEFEINAVAGANHQEQLLLMVSSGTAPDIWFDANRTTGPLTRKGLTLNLEPFLEADPNFNEDDYVENVWIAQTYDGARWGLPWDSGAMCMAFNMDLFDQVGLEYPDPQRWMTWDEIIELAKQLTFDLDGNTPNDPGFDPARVKQYGLMADTGHGRPTYIWSNNAEIIAADGTMPMDTPEFIEAMNWLADLGLKHFVSPSPAYEAAGEVSLQAQTVAMQHIGVWLLGRINQAGINWGTFQVPYSKTRVSYGHYSPLCIYRQTEHPQEAYDFVFFACCSREGEKILVDMGMQQPIRKDLREDFLNNEAPPAKEYRQVFYDAFENQETFRWPGDTIGSYYGGWYQTLIDFWGPYLDQLWLGQVRWEDVATEVRQGSEHILQTGEMP